MSGVTRFVDSDGLVIQVVVELEVKAFDVLERGNDLWRVVEFANRTQGNVRYTRTC